MSFKSIRSLNSDENFIGHHDLASILITYCKSRDQKLCRKTAELTVGILLLNSYWSNKFGTETSKIEIQSFMLDCFKFLFAEKSISSTTIKMQCLFYGKCLTKEQFKDQKREIVMKNCNHLMQKLKKVWHNHTEDFADMHDELVKLILIKEGMDDKEDHSAFDEMKTSLNSILPASELSAFVTKNQKIKTSLINEVSSIAAGIRLYAWYSNKAGKFMFDVVKLMKETLPKISEDIHEEVVSTKELIENSQKYFKDKATDNEDNSEIIHKKQLLICSTNYYSFIKNLKEYIDEIAAETYKLDYRFIVCIKELNSTLKGGPFSKADKAYPLYKEIGQTWKNLQLEGYLLDFYINLYMEFKSMHENILKSSEPQEFEELNFNCCDYQECEEKPLLIQPESIKNFADVTLETNEFCAYYCSKGVLVPAVKEIGLLMYQNSCYGFSSNEAMMYFQKQPIVCIELGKQYMKIMPELIISICKEEYFGLPMINTMRRKKVSPVFISDRSIQTVLHSTDENIDYTYNWNQWDMRKKALKYADLLNKKTHSTQTDLSHFRRENFSQVYLPKDNWTQTRRDTSTTMARAGIPELSIHIKKSFL